MKLNKENSYLQVNDNDKMDMFLLNRYYIFSLFLIFTTIIISNKFIKCKYII
jgi:hypothetical protein